MVDESMKTEVATDTVTSPVAKAWWKSKVIWVAAVGLAAAVSGVFGYELDADTQSAIANVMTSIMSAF